MIKLSDKTIAAIEENATRYPDRNSVLMFGLWKAQEELGHLSPEAIEAVAEAVRVPRAKAQGVATYHSLYWKKPVGENVIMLCTNVACTLMGAETILEHIENRLGIKEGHTTPDGKFTLQEVECIGSCGYGPAMVINETFYFDLTINKIDDILAKL
ncbi:MAG: NADH-quinone oxidoreductase subunit NuoE [Nitrospirae bacterium]|nr:NADH-quinone oxidoreductase subunit NuoE [Nitrospirota bacterium]MBI5696680.1 NADH-quinone oxidoreductase subunit NuoE [Nitrospirota bacterium]